MEGRLKPALRGGGEDFVEGTVGEFGVGFVLEAGGGAGGIGAVERGAEGRRFSGRLRRPASPAWCRLGGSRR